MDSGLLIAGILGFPILVTYISVITKLTLDYLTTHEVFHGPRNDGKE